MDALPGFPLLAGCHYFCRSAARLEQRDHLLHRRTAVGEEGVETFAEVIVVRLAAVGAGEAVFGAAAVAQSANRAIVALAGQRFALGLAECHLLGRGDQIEHRGLVDIAQEETRLDEVVAGINIAIVLQGQALPAGRGMDAEQVFTELGL